MKKLQFRYFNRDRKGDTKGKMFGQRHKTKGNTYDYFFQMYVDDEVFLFETKEDLTRGANLIYQLFDDLGLQMHIGRDGGKSKTEVMYFPPSLQKTAYDKIDYDEQIPVSDGYVTITRSFKYLGSWITDTLQDTKEVQVRIQKARAQIGMLYPFFKSDEVPLPTKYMVYCAIPLNTVLWGCESWAVTADMVRSLESFHHKSIRSILNVNMRHVEEFRIQNQEVRKWFMNIPNITDTMMKRQLQWLQKIITMGDERAPRKLVASWTAHPRKPGHPQKTRTESHTPWL